MSDLNRREFLKVIGAAGASAAFVSTFVPQAAFAQAPAVDAINPEYLAGITGAKFDRAVAIATAGPGNNLAWANGDSIKFLPPERIPVSAKYVQTFLALGKDKVLALYNMMVKFHNWENVGKDLFMGAKEGLYGYYHMYLGEDAIATGVMASLNTNDYITSTHRGHAHVIEKGGDLVKMAAEMYLHADGYNKGYGGSMHIVDMTKGIMGTNGIVGGGWQLAAGASWSAKQQGKGQIAVCFAGDGAANSRYFFNSVRNAKQFQMPYLPIIENNFQSAGTPGGKVNGVKYQSDLVKGLGVPVFLVDGNDIAAVWSAAKEAVDYVRKNSSPALVEAMTYRWYDHMGFSGAKLGQDGAFGLPYRSDDEVKAWLGRNPVVRFANLILDSKIATQAEIDAINTASMKEAADAWAKGKTGPLCKPEDGLKNTYESGSVAATQFIDRKVTTAWTTPSYLKRGPNPIVEA